MPLIDVTANEQVAATSTPPPGPPTNADMFKIMRKLAIPMSVKKILGPRGRKLTTWGEVNRFMRYQQATYKTQGFATKGWEATKLLKKLREFYLANEARKAHNK